MPRGKVANRQPIWGSSKLPLGRSAADGSAAEARSGLARKASVGDALGIKAGRFEATSWDVFAWYRASTEQGFYKLLLHYGTILAVERQTRCGTSNR